jgi:phosphoesterase RecJ-like protein
VDIDQELASLMYITLLTDTAGFRHANTNELALTWGAELIKLGAAPSELYNKLFNQIPAKAIQIGGAALAALKIHELKRGAKTIVVAYTETSRADLNQYGADDEDTDEIVDHVMRIRGLDACLYLREGRRAGTYKGSLRSANPDIDCAKLAGLINGGGHARAAGFNIEAKSFSELQAKVFGLLQG